MHLMGSARLRVVWCGVLSVAAVLAAVAVVKLRSGRDRHG